MSRSASSSSSSSQRSPKAAGKAPATAPATVEKVTNRHGMDTVVLKNAIGYTVRISTYGGQVLSWKTDLGEELLFMSSKAVYKAPMAIRGGIPLCFPQVGNRGTLEQHGFARNKLWTLDTDAPPLPSGDSVNKVFTDLLLQPSMEDLKVWPHRYEFRLRVSLGAEGYLFLIPRIRNVDTKPFAFSFAFRTYLAVSHISEVRIEGLETQDYLDNLKDRERFTDQGNSLTFESETDRVYVNTGDMVAVRDHHKKQTILVCKGGLPDFVVWNPWDKKAKAIPDLGDTDYEKMVCVDGAAIERPITLKPNQEWTGKLSLFLQRSS